MKMKRILLTLLLLSLLVPAALAETALVPDYYAPLNPTLTRMAGPDDWTVTAVRASAYLSANEVWYLFSPLLDKTATVLARYDKWGALRDSVTLDLPGTDQNVLCVTRVGDRLLIGATVSMRGVVIVLDENLRELMRVMLAEGVGIMSMKPAPEGILCSGFAWEGTQDCLYMALVDAQGHVAFENKLAVGEAEVDMTAVAESQTCAGDNGYYAMISRRTGGWIQSRDRSVAGFDAAGQLRWEQPLPETIEVNGVTAAGGVVYAYGNYGELNEYDVRDETQAWVGAWSEDGTCLWQRIFEAPMGFNKCAADESACYLMGFSYGIAAEYVAALTPQGELLAMSMLQVPDDACVTGVALDGRALQVTGYLHVGEMLFQFEVR